MEQNRIDIDETLGKVSPVSAPSFLFTRIESRLEGRDYQLVFKPWMAMAGVLILIAVNIGVLSRSAQVGANEDLMIVLTELSIQTSNQLYHE